MVIKNLDLIIPSKLREPPLNQNMVVRSDLIKKLDSGLKKKLTLVSAPAGFGKTTLVLSWLAENHLPVSWISLDKQDDNPARFLTYLFTSIAKYKPGLLKYLENAMNSKELDSDYTVTLDYLLLELTSKPPFIVIVLDDYHLIRHPLIHEMMSYLIQNSPQNHNIQVIPDFGCHFVVTTRTDPPFPLSRWKLNDEITEIRTRDLRFSLQECRAIFNEVHHFNLDNDEIQSISERTQGWIASMQLVALSLADLSPSEYSTHIRDIKGNNRVINDYLSEEVFSRLDEETQAFLVQTSILDQKNGQLCDEVTQTTNSQTRLEMLEKSNIFVMPMDDERGWYRYHPLFNDFLKSRLPIYPNDQIRELHSRAARWFEKNDCIEDSLRHWMTIGKYDEATRVVADFSPRILSRAQFYILRNIIEEFPNEAFQIWPWLCIYRAWAYFTHNLDLGETWLKASEELLQNENIRSQYSHNNINEMVGNIAALRALCAFRKGNIDVIIQNAPRALEYLPADSRKVRGLVLYATAGGQAFQFNLEEAYQNSILAREMLLQSGNIGGASEAIAKAGEIQLVFGNLHAAEEILIEGIELEKLVEDSYQTLSCLAYRILGEVYYEWDRVDEALACLNKSCSKSKLMGTSMEVLCDQSLANLFLRMGDVEAADRLISRYGHEEKYQKLLPWDQKQVIGNLVLLNALQGKTTEVHRMLMDYDNLRLNPDLNSEASLISFAFALYHLHEFDACLELALPMLDQMDHGRRYGREIRLLNLIASAYCQKGDSNNGMPYLQKSLILGRKEGFYRPFLDLADPLLESLTKINQKDGGVQDLGSQKYLSDLIQRFLLTTADHVHPIPRSDTKNTQASVPIEFSDYMTEQEKRVLKLLISGMNNKEIAVELCISVNTVKKHIANIYGKLNVHNRFQANVRMQQLQIKL